MNIKAGSDILNTQGSISNDPAMLCHCSLLRKDIQSLVDCFARL